MKVDVAIVGAGPAGLRAASIIAKQGGRVVVIDENARFGGKLPGQLHEEPDSGHWWMGGEIAQSLIEEAEAEGVQLWRETVVWGLEKGWTLQTANILNRSGSSRRIEAQAVLLATGASEKPLPVPGWTLPGVMTIGAAQVLTNVYRVKPGNRVLVAGLDALSLTIARAMGLAGVHVVGIVLPPKSELIDQQISEPKNVLRQLASMVHLAPSRLLRAGGAILRQPWGIALASRWYPAKGVKVWGIPIQIRKALISVEGEERVTGAEVADIDPEGNVVAGTGRRLEVDAVCLSGGLMPLAELAAMAGCRFVRLPGLSGAVPLHSPMLETDVDNLFVAGNITGVEGAKVALAQGELAGMAICRKLGVGSLSEADLRSACQRVEDVRAKADIQFHSEIRLSRKRLANLWAEHGAQAGKGEAVR